MKELWKKISEHYKEGMLLYAAGAEPIRLMDQTRAGEQLPLKK